MDVSSIAGVLRVVQGICYTGGGICAVGALIMYAINKFSPQASDGVSEGRMMGLILGAAAFFAAAVLVTTVNINFG